MTIVETCLQTLTFYQCNRKLSLICYKISEIGLASSKGISSKDPIKAEPTACNNNTYILLFVPRHVPVFPVCVRQPLFVIDNP